MLNINLNLKNDFLLFRYCDIYVSNCKTPGKISTQVTIYRATQATFKPKFKKKFPPRKNFFHFRKWNFLAPRLKSF